ncbi:MAG: gluconate 2-dehydrogenase subunit 3 family protein [Bryobacteraceae bacterium]|nr:gluconate 2-dehydrogenase subunit 3 family protein [Bryobacteraceae bacterium]
MTPDRRQIIAALLGLGTLPERGFTQETLPLSAADAVAEGWSRFFTPAELKSFRTLGDTLVPAYEGRPGALEAQAPEFLDFLLSRSGIDVQTLYRQGLARYAAKPDLTPLNKPWTLGNAPGGTAHPELAQDPYERFLRAAKQAFYQATVNSRQWAEASRGRGSSNLYWLPVASR